MPPEPLETPASGGRLIELIQPSLSNSLSLYTLQGLVF